jgi:hypothetical protein
LRDLYGYTFYQPGLKPLSLPVASPCVLRGRPRAIVRLRHGRRASLRAHVRLRGDRRASQRWRVAEAGWRASKRQQPRLARSPRHTATCTAFSYSAPLICARTPDYRKLMPKVWTHHCDSERVVTMFHPTFLLPPAPRRSSLSPMTRARRSTNNTGSQAAGSCRRPGTGNRRLRRRRERRTKRGSLHRAARLARCQLRAPPASPPDRHKCSQLHPLVVHECIAVHRTQGVPIAHMTYPARNTLSAIQQY